MNISDPKTDLLRLRPMNRIMNVFVIGFLCLINVLSATTAPSVFSVNDRYSDEELAMQISQLSTNIDVKFTQEVKTIINTYISSGRAGSEAILGRSNYYFPIMEKIIKKHNLPEEIKYLSVIESGLRPTVKSKAGAVGLWQFISSTAKMYDLRVGKIHDERQDVARSTEAAMLYLNDLHNRFGDWSLALAAYNCGPGNINKALKRAGGGEKSYWEIRKYLPKETRRYLPKLVATMYVMTYFDHYGMTNISNDYTEYKAFGIAEIFEKTSFEKISELSGFSIEQITKYNPAYKYKYIPSSSKGNTLIMPELYLTSFLTNTNQLSQFRDVFYMNSYRPLENVQLTIEEPQMPEINRTVVSTTYLELQTFHKLSLSPSVQFKASLTIVEDEEVIRKATPIRLRKRQSYQEYKAKKFTPSVRKDRILPTINVAGIVTSN